MLFGDFLQLGAVLDGPVEHSDNAAVRMWVQATCFSHVGITTPEAAERHPACVVLRHQFRFGPELRRLANDVVYKVLQDARDLPGVRANPSTEIIVVDVSTVPDLAVVQRSGSGRNWWAAGLVLSRALAELHRPESTGEAAIGIVTPYRTQSEATLAALRDQDVIGGVACGTVHSFQGREFDTLVFDLVEEGHGWVAAAGQRPVTSFGHAGMRLFAVAVTRARHRLYLLADGGAVRTASAGPLRALREAVGRGDARVWSAAGLLGLDDPPADHADPVFDEVAELLRQTVAVRMVDDEVSFGAELQRHLDAARSSVWMWSPWVFNRAAVVVPLIERAVQRGVAVRVFIRPDSDRNMASPRAQAQLPALYDSGATVIRSDHEHRKIVVIDRRVVLYGSLNVLSNNPGSTRESMLTLDGRAFAERLLVELDAETFGTPKPCTGCGTVMEVRGGGKSRRFRWECRSCNIRVNAPAGVNRRAGVAGASAAG